MKPFLAIPLLLVLAGCANRFQSNMPLDPENVWTYQAEPGLQKETADLKVSSPIAVGKVQGTLLTSDWGNAELAWDGETLYAAQLGGTRYSPPLPILAKLRPEDKLDWEGQITVAGNPRSAAATLQTKENEARVGTRTLPATESVLTLTIGPDTHEIQTWFVPGYGIARQEQRKNGLLTNRLTYLGGP